MSKIFRDAALIVGGIALAATGFGAAVSAGILGSNIGIGAAGILAGKVALIASVASSGLGIVARSLQKKPMVTGPPMRWCT
jgi:hypothetical protein